ncbi:MAG: hypothetical protein P8R42_25060 [Candidatus Binatia bacterium]|nr:hypothetical protein [Candidatus Binatia bacterium]
MRIQILSVLSAGLAVGALLLTGAPAQAEPQGLDIGKVSLNLAFQPGPRQPGQVKIKGIVDDNDTENLVADLLTNTVTVRIVDGDAFDVTATLTNCTLGATSVVCNDDSTGYRVRAHVKRWKNFKDVWRANFRVKDLTEADTGFGPLTEPVTVTLTHGAKTRVDVVAQAGGNEGDCKVKKRGARLRCKSK